MVKFCGELVQLYGELVTILPGFAQDALELGQVFGLWQIVLELFLVHVMHLK